MIRRFAPVLLALAVFTIASAPRPQLLAPPQHADFDHYTFALTWQPGMCGTEEGCLPDQPHTPLIGLHGLWASLPRALSGQGVVDKQWWSKGCDYYGATHEAPPISSELRGELDAVMPHFEHSLLTHEYDKHVACFGFDPARFFTVELAMRDAVVSSPFGTYLMKQAGHDVSHDVVVDTFEKSFNTADATTLQLQCGKTASGQIVLTQFWITIQSGAVDAFPDPSSFMNTPTNQDTCPQTFHVPAW